MQIVKLKDIEEMSSLSYYLKILAAKKIAAEDISQYGIKYPGKRLKRVNFYKNRAIVSVDLTIPGEDPLYLKVKVDNESIDYYLNNLNEDDYILIFNNAVRMLQKQRR